MVNLSDSDNGTGMIYLTSAVDLLDPDDILTKCLGTVGKAEARKL